MVFESSLAPMAAQFTESLNVKPAPGAEQTSDEMSQDAKTPEQSGDIVTISEEARALAAPENSGNSKESGSDSEGNTPQEQVIVNLERQIEDLEEELKELEESDLPEKEKLQQIQAKEVQLMELREQLLKAEDEILKAGGYADGGGTRANGFGNSAGSF